MAGKGNGRKVRVEKAVKAKACTFCKEKNTPSGMIIEMNAPAVRRCQS